MAAGEWTDAETRRPMGTTERVKLKGGELLTNEV